MVLKKDNLDFPFNVHSINTDRILHLDVGLAPAKLVPFSAFEINKLEGRSLEFLFVPHDTINDFIFEEGEYICEIYVNTNGNNDWTFADKFTFTVDEIDLSQILPPEIQPVGTLTKWIWRDKATIERLDLDKKLLET